MINQVLIFIFAFFGGVTRYFLSLNFSWGIFPIATLIVNLIGAAFLPYWNENLSAKNEFTQKIKEPVGVGFCGALTTFSTMMLDVFRLVTAHHLVIAIIYLLLTMIGGVLVTGISASFAERVVE